MANLSASDIAGRRIREIRQRYGWTAKELADRCAELGAPRITATVVTNLETRRRATREITLDEVLILARALEVPPLQLMVPLDAGEALEVAPGTELDGMEAVHWIAADPFLTRYQVLIGLGDEDTSDLVRWAESDPITTIVRQIRFASWYIRAEDEVLEHGGGRADIAAKLLPMLADRLMHFRARMEALGYEPPRLGEVSEVLRRHGLPATLEEWRKQDARSGALLSGDQGGPRVES